MSDKPSATPDPVDGPDSMHRSARIVLEQGRATIERTKALIEKARRLTSPEKPAGQEQDS